MKYLPLLLLLLLSCEKEKIILNQFTDERDGEVYGYVELGNQIWMTENLRYIHPVFDCLETSYGIMYPFVALDAVCPDGWHIPSQSEWIELIDFLGYNPVAELKENGFEVVYAGWFQVEYVSQGRIAAWWSSTEVFEDYAWVYYINEWKNILQTNLPLTSKLTVRCVKD